MNHLQYHNRCIIILTASVASQAHVGPTSSAIIDRESQWITIAGSNVYYLSMDFFFNYDYNIFRQT